MYLNLIDLVSTPIGIRKSSPTHDLMDFHHQKIEQKDIPDTILWFLFTILPSGNSSTVPGFHRHYGSAEQSAPAHFLFYHLSNPSSVHHSATPGHDLPPHGFSSYSIRPY